VISFVSQALDAGLDIALLSLVTELKFIVQY